MWIFKKQNEIKTSNTTIILSELSLTLENVRMAQHREVFNHMYDPWHNLVMHHQVSLFSYDFFPGQSGIIKCLLTTTKKLTSIRFFDFSGAREPNFKRDFFFWWFLYGLYWLPEKAWHWIPNGVYAVIMNVFNLHACIMQ